MTYLDDFEQEAKEQAECVERWEELPWLRKHGPTIACIVAVLGTILLLSFGISH